VGDPVILRTLSLTFLLGAPAAPALPAGLAPAERAIAGARAAAAERPAASDGSRETAPDLTSVAAPAVHPREEGNARGGAHATGPKAPDPVALASSTPPDASLTETPDPVDADGYDDLADALLTLDDVVVTGSRGERSRESAAVATEVIGRGEIEVSGARTVGDILRTHPGVDVFGDVGLTSIRIQGLDPEYLLVLVNGERTVGRVNGAIDLSRYRVEDIERIEIVRGASSSLYGSDAIAGVINIITRQSRRPLEVDANLQYGSLERLDLGGGVGLSRGDWSTRFTAGWHKGAGYDLDPATVATTGSAYDTVNVANHTRFKAGGTQVDGDVAFMRRDQRGVDQNINGATFDRRNLVETFSVGVRPGFRIGEGKLRFNGAYSIYRDQYLLDQRSSNVLDQYQNTHEQLGELGVQFEQALGAHVITIGAEGLYESLASERIASGLGSRLRGSLYAQDEWTLIESIQLMAVPGLRVDMDSQFGTYLSPKLSLRVDPAPKLALRASHGFGYRAPNFKDLYLRFENPGVGYIVEGNPALRPETSRSLNVGAEYAPLEWMKASLNVFRNDIRDLITFVMIQEGGGGTTRYLNENVASAHTQGVESMLRLTPLRGLSTDLGYTFTDTRDHATGLELPGRAAHRGTFTLHYALWPWKVDAMVRGNIVSASSIHSVDSTGAITLLKAPAHASIDARLAKDFGGSVTAFVQAENLLGAGDPVLLPILPRTFTAGLTARY